jgi:hypothetical protein
MKKVKWSFRLFASSLLWNIFIQTTTAPIAPVSLSVNNNQTFAESVALQEVGLGRIALNGTPAAVVNVPVLAHGQYIILPTDLTSSNNQVH